MYMYIITSSIIYYLPVYSAGFAIHLLDSEDAQKSL